MELKKAVEIPHRVIPLELDGVESQILRSGIAYWTSLCRGRPHPSRPELDPHGLKPILANTMLLQVVGECEDYEYRIVGDAHVQIHAFSQFPTRLSQLDEFLPGYAGILKPLYDRVARLKAPFAMRGIIERPDGFPKLTASESVFLPLGPNAQTVDHILNFSVYQPTDRMEDHPAKADR